ncbi:SPOSA6832_02360 [Sporobolomyces salmonicolor]|uniref:SPOSA6832_02360-mRNA-1:cds n=1 Tax=Sporidiobolus salmonicolor TaxID=5005 RepID=A0A0D6EM56_SPOSA|nr:SPOSA6832_02360 [Sporobolomyces salmonicolor]
MPSATQTLSSTLSSLSLRGSQPSQPPTTTTPFKVAPLEPSGALNEQRFPRVELTPALGDKFDASVRLKELLQLPKEEGDAVLRDLAILVSHRGVVFFQDQHDLVPEDLGILALRLGELAGKPAESTLHMCVFALSSSLLTRALPASTRGNKLSLTGRPKFYSHPTQELSETGLPLGKISSLPEKDGRQISFAESGLTSKGWHSDVSFEPYPSLFTILKMHTIPKVGGDTLWHSNYHSYNALTPAYRAFLEGLTATHDAERFRIQARVNGYKLRTEARGHPANDGDAFQAVHPVIRCVSLSSSFLQRSCAAPDSSLYNAVYQLTADVSAGSTNQVTGQKALYVNTTFTARINELSYDESRSVLDYLFKLQHESHDAHVKYKWAKHDVALWSNSVVNHLATFDFSEYRAGDRAVVVGEKPYYDPASIGRREYLEGLQAAA